MGVGIQCGSVIRESMETAILQLLAFVLALLPCVGVILLIIAIPVFGIWSRVRFANRIQKLAKQGAYTHWDRSPIGLRARLFAGLGIVSMSGVFLWGALFLFNRLAATSTPGLVLLAFMLGTAIMSGFVLQYTVAHPK